MKLIHCQDELEIVQKANSWCQEKTSEYQSTSIYLPAGETPKKLYANWEKERPNFLNGQSLLQIDDVIGHSTKAGIFRQFFIQNLPSFKKQLLPLGEEAQPADLGILGLGTNGHVAFHEPGVPFDFSFGQVLLSDETCDNLRIERKSYGLSYGVGSFLNCKALLLIVRGEKKRSALEDIVSAKPQTPAGQLKCHEDLTILVDKFSLGEISHNL